MTLRYLPRAAGLTALLAVTIGSAYSQGVFPPPAGPAVPAMKTLQQVEPRVDLLNSVGSNGVTTDANDLFVISSPGSYYLSGNLVVTKSIGILINSSSVTLDLNGFEISRAGAAGGMGIVASSGADNTAVFNGSLRGFEVGIECLLNLPFPRACVFHHLRFGSCTLIGIEASGGSVTTACASSNCGRGISTKENNVIDGFVAEASTDNFSISAGAGSVLTRCSVYGTANTDPASCAIRTFDSAVVSECLVTGCSCSRGIKVGQGGTLSHCAVNLNTAAYAFDLGPGSTATNCTATSNTSSASSSGGFLAAGNCNLQQCSSSSNASTAATLTSSTAFGFSVGGGSTIQGCTASGNKGDGIDVTNSSVLQCSSISNQQSGIRADNGGAVLDCSACSNTFSGIVVESIGKFDIRGNNCESNGSSANPGAGIQIKGPFTRVDGNHITQNYRGIEVVNGVVGVFVVRNAAALNLDVNFKIAGGNKVGTIVSAPASGVINGSTGSAGVGSADPWANISY